MVWRIMKRLSVVLLVIIIPDKEVGVFAMCVVNQQTELQKKYLSHK